MERLRDSLSKKLTGMNMLVSGCALLLASAAFFAYDYYTFRNALVRNTSVQAKIVGANVDAALVSGDRSSAEDTLRALRASNNLVYAGVYTAQREFFAGYPRQPGTPIALPTFDTNLGESHWMSQGRLHLLQTITFEGQTVGIVYMQMGLAPIYARLRSYATILLLIVTASLIAALALSRLTQHSISDPILRLAGFVRQVSREKDFAARVPIPEGHDEFRVLVNAFNDMLGEIQDRDTALQESEEQFRNLANSIPQLAFMSEPDGYLFWYNDRWYQYTGSKADEMLGWGWQTAHDPDVLPEVLAKWRTSLSTGHLFEMIFPLRGADGNFRDFLTRALPVLDARGHVARWFGTLTDVTEQRRAEEALRQTEKLAATGRLAASIAHEINNPLETVTNLVYLARKQPAGVEKYLQLADHELDRIAQITRNTLGFYRDSASPKPVNISTVLEEVVALYARKLEFKSITLLPDYGDSIEVEGYGGEIRQIFANLVSNAIEALPARGSLRIRASRVSADHPGARITFLDNGVGIPITDRKKIFEPFYTTKKDVGTGLGLWLTMNLLQKHGGRLNVRSCAEPGRSWTAFSIFLPNALQPAEPNRREREGVR